MIRLAVPALTEKERKTQFTDLLHYLSEKMAGERSDSHDTATQAYVIVKKIEHRAREGGAFTVDVSNEFARPTARELRMFLSYQTMRSRNERGPQKLYPLLYDLRDTLEQNIKRQDAEKWAEERAKQMKRRPTVREARSA